MNPQVIVVAYETAPDGPFVEAIPIAADARLKDKAKIQADIERKKAARLAEAPFHPVTGKIVGCRMREVGEEKGEEINPWEAFSDFGTVEHMLVLHPSRFLRMALISGARAGHTAFAPYITSELREGFVSGKCTDPVKTIFGSSDIPVETILSKLNIELGNEFVDRYMSQDMKDRLLAQEELLHLLGELFW